MLTHPIARRWNTATSRQRTISVLLTALIITTTIAVPVRQYLENQKYVLDQKTIALVGSVNKNLAAKLIYNPEKSQWQFNSDAMNAVTSDDASAALASLKSQTGGSGADDQSLYAATFASNPKDGMKFYDSQTKLSFKMIPKFDVASARESDGRLIYPMHGSAKLIYSAKNNGMKEDIILPKYTKDELSFSYELQLPDTLRAKVLDDGSVGVYSADPILFGNITSTNEMDSEKLESARKSAEKNHMLFAIPAPIINHSDGGPAPAHAHFELSGSTLTVVAKNMKNISYPASVDPSIVVTNTSQFTSGNNEDNITYPTDKISRAALSGGSVQSWASTSSGSFTARFGGGSAAFGGYVYYIGGNNGSSLSEVNYAPINSNGTIGTWATTTSLPSGRTYAAAMPYNGRMYVYGGYNSGTTALNSVIYASINSDGTLGSWTSATNTMIKDVCRFGSAVYDGRLYAAGGATGTVASNCGNSSTTLTNTTQSAPILANGDVGAWTTSASTFSSPRKDAGLAIYNGNAYLTSGTTDGVTTYRDTQIAGISSNGDLINWRTSSELTPTNGKYRFGYRSYNGYLYMLGGTNNLTTILYAQIYANGDIGSWQTGSAMTTGRYSPGFAFYGNYAYFFGGNDTSVSLNDTGYAKLDDGGISGTSVATTPLSANNSNAITASSSFVYNGYIYAAGGFGQTTSYTDRVLYAKLNTDGTIGTWATTSSLLAPASGGTGLGGMGYAISNGRIYMIAGVTTAGGSGQIVNSIQYASFNANGTLSSWTMNPTNYVGAVQNQSAVAYNGYIYMMGSGGGGPTNRVYYAPVNNDGTLGSWTWEGSGSNNIPIATTLSGMVAHNGYIYIAGGLSSPTYYSNVYYAKINSDGTLGTWNTTSSLITPRDRHGLVVVNGYMYALAGESTGGNDIASIEYAAINSDGSLGSWSASTSASATFSNYSAASWGDSIYLLSGRINSARSANVHMIKVRNGGSGTNTSWTASANSLSTARQKFASTTYNGYVYSAGGQTAGGTYLSSVEYSKLGDTGSIGTWSGTTSLPSARSKFGLTAYKGRLFAFGGETASNTPSNAVYSAPINSNGTIGSWTSQTNLPAQLSGLAITRDGARVYALGGTTGSPATTVYTATLSSSGSVSAWTSLGSFSGARSGASAVVSNGSIYIAGGIDGSNNYYRDMQYAAVNGDGSLGSWQSAVDMTSQRAYGTLTTYNGFLYYIGGTNGTSTRSNVEFAALAKGGGIGRWTTGTPLSAARQGHQTIMYNGYVYSLGGNDGTNDQANVTSSPLLTQSHISRYSKLFDLGAAYTLTGATYGGTVSGDAEILTYRGAPASGAFGATSDASSIQSSGVVSCSIGSVRYVQLNALLDDTTNAAFPDTGATSSVTNLTVSYNLSHATPDKRLAHGKYFQDESLQALDTCTD